MTLLEKQLEKIEKDLTDSKRSELVSFIAHLLDEVKRLKEHNEVLASDIHIQCGAERARWKHVLGSVDPDYDVGELCEMAARRLAAAENVCEAIQQGKSGIKQLERWRQARKDTDAE